MPMILKPCPRCGQDSQQGLVYYVCNPCGFAFDSAGSVAPDGSLDHPMGRDMVNDCARSMEVVARAVHLGHIKKEQAQLLAVGFIVAADLEPGDVSIAAGAMRSAYLAAKRSPS